MFEHVEGQDILQTEAEAIVNPVNCEGVMGKGLAYQIKKAYPENFALYKKACKAGFLAPGKLCHYHESGKIIINFPTKVGWKDKSKMSYIESGLDALAQLIEELDIKSVAVPPLGAGNGGLLWSHVSGKIWTYLEPVSYKRRIIVYGPPEDKMPFRAPRLGVMELLLLRLMELYPDDADKRGELYVKGIAALRVFGRTPPLQMLAASQKAVNGYIEHYGFNSPKEAYAEAYRTLVSKNIEKSFEILAPIIEQED